MHVVWRKCRSLWRHAHDPAALRLAVRRNLAWLRACCGPSRGFVYDSAVGVRFVCYPDNPTSLRLYLSGYQEQAEMALARSWLRPGDRCVDVGANVGLWSMVFAEAVGAGGHVLALEPSPLAYARLCDAARALDRRNLSTMAVAVSDAAGMSAFHVAHGTGADAEEDSIRVAAARRHQFRNVVVPCTTLDDVCAAHGDAAQAALVKIDVEGAEPQVLRGAGATLGAPSPPLVVVEVHRTALANFERTPDDVLAHFPAARFTRYFVPRSVSDARSDRRHGIVYPLHDAGELPIYANVVAVPRHGWEDGRRAAVQAAAARHGHLPAGA